MTAALHAQPVPSRPDTVRWVVPPTGVVPGRLRNAPGELGRMLAAEEIMLALVEPSGIWLTLAAGLSWRAEGDRVRGALVEALADVDSWEIDEDVDGILAQVVADVLAGPTGDYVRSHGGSVAIRGVHDGVVDLEFQGACSNCSAAGQTLHDRLDTAVRQRFPQLERLHDVDEGIKRTGHFTLWPTVRRPD